MREFIDSIIDACSKYNKEITWIHLPYDMLNDLKKELEKSIIDRNVKLSNSFFYRGVIFNLSRDIEIELEK